jgi:ParB-like chromosome segregation protein Spo0J
VQKNKAVHQRAREVRQAAEREGHPSAPPLESTPGEWIDESRISDNPFQPRKFISMRRLKRLIRSMDKHGQMVAARVMRDPKRDGYFIFVFGHRRREAIRAGCNAGIKMPNPDLYIGKIYCEVFDANTFSDEELLDAAYCENADREDFSVFDRAHYYQLKIEEVSKKLQPVASWGKDGRPTKLVSPEELVSIERLEVGARMIRTLLDVQRLPQALQQRLSDLDLSDPDEDEESEGANIKHCLALLSLQPKEQRDPKKAANAAQLRLMDEIEEKKLSGNAAVKRAKEERKPAAAASGAAASGTANDAAEASGSGTSGNGSGSGTSGNGTSGTGAGEESGQGDYLISEVSQARTHVVRVTAQIQKGNVTAQLRLELLREFDVIESNLQLARKELK